MRLNKRKLQALIDECASASNRFYKAQDELNNYCRDVYGTEPGEIDADEIIDAVMGGAGLTAGMTADDFDAAMRSPVANRAKN